MKKPSPNDQEPTTPRETSTAPHAGASSAASGTAADTDTAATAAVPTQPHQSRHIWSVARRCVVSIIVFILLMAGLIGLSRITTIAWTGEPTDQSISTMSNDTSVAYEAGGETLPAKGTYEVETISDYIDLVRPDTGEVQHAHILVRVPVGVSASGSTADAKLADGATAPSSALPAKLPAAVYMHGAGYGTAENSFGDVATDLASAGFVTLTVDKPVWSTNDVTRDYPGSAHAYDQCIKYLRNLSYVDSGKVGIYATSEGAWIAPYVIREDGDIAFQVLLSPLVFNPLNALAFFVSQDFSIVGANPGYKNLVQRVFSADLAFLGLDNVNFQAMLPESYSVPTFVAYGSKDVMTPQVEGAATILSMAHDAGNWDVTIRNYPIGNHVLRIGDEAETGTVLVDHYEDDFVDWAVGQTRGLEQTTPAVAGATIRQAVAVPQNLHPRRAATVYGIAIHVLQILLLLVLLVCVIIAAVKHIIKKHRKEGSALGYSRYFKRLLLLSFICTFGSLLFFFSQLGQVVLRVVKLIWGAAPVAPGAIWWGWYAVQVVCCMVVFVWACVFAAGLEVLDAHGLLRAPWKPRRPAAPEAVDDVPFAATTFGRFTAVVCMLEILLILLVLAFWGLFIYW